MSTITISFPDWGAAPVPAHRPPRRRWRANVSQILRLQNILSNLQQANEHLEREKELLILVLADRLNEPEELSG